MWAICGRFGNKKTDTEATRQSHPVSAECTQAAERGYDNCSLNGGSGKEENSPARSVERWYRPRLHPGQQFDTQAGRLAKIYADFRAARRGRWIAPARPNLE